MGLFDGMLVGSSAPEWYRSSTGFSNSTAGCRGSSTNSRRTDSAPSQFVGGNGTEPTITPAQVHQALGPDLLQQLSAKSGLSVQELAEKLSQVLPQAVDKMTPNGTIPNS